MLWHPVGCRPCDYDRCPTGHECAEGVTVDAVVREAFGLLAVFGDANHAAA